MSQSSSLILRDANFFVITNDCRQTDDHRFQHFHRDPRAGRQNPVDWRFVEQVDVQRTAQSNGEVCPIVEAGR